MSNMIMMMNREVKRVSLSFGWPLNKVWKGYLNPFNKKCPNCENGYTSARRRLEEIVNLLMLSGSDSLKEKNHPYFDWGYFDNNIIPSKDMAELTIGLAGRKLSSLFGHDACDRWLAIEKIIKVAGLDPDIWGVCKICKGNGIDPQFKKQHDEWQPTEPPKGEGYQCWETVSEGSPISPVFKTLDELCQWLANNSKGVTKKLSKEDWFKALSEKCPVIDMISGDKVNPSPNKQRRGG